MNIDRPDTIQPKSQHELPICHGATPVQIVATPSGHGQWAYRSRQKQKGPAEKKQTNSSISSFLECFRYWWKPARFSILRFQGANRKVQDLPNYVDVVDHNLELTHSGTSGVLGCQLQGTNRDIYHSEGRAGRSHKWDGFNIRHVGICQELRTGSLIIKQLGLKLWGSFSLTHVIPFRDVAILTRYGFDF